MGLKRRKHGDRGRHIRPLLFDDRCARCGEYLIPREFGTGGDAYHLPPGWLSENLRPDHEHDTLVHTGCSTPAAEPETRRTISGFLRRH